MTSAGGTKLKSTSVPCHLEIVSGTIQVPLSTGLRHFHSSNHLNPQPNLQLHLGSVQTQLCGGSWLIGNDSLAEAWLVRCVFLLSTCHTPVFNSLYTNIPTEKPQRVKQENLLSKFQEVIWREVLHCYDEAYAYKLLSFLPNGYENRTPQSVFRNRPKLYELEDALYQVSKISSSPLARETWAKPLHNLSQSKNNPAAIEELMTQLTSPNWTERFLARHTIVYLGGETVTFLLNRLSDPNEEWSETIKWLLENIALETSKELPKQVSRLLCPKCIVMCGKNKVKLTRNRSITFYGCQMCYQSRKFMERPTQIVAVLDSTMKAKQTQTGKQGVLWVNWLRRKKLFEFDRVEIIEATDEEVELFAVQVGNELDRNRRSRYKKMKCTIQPTCRLMENTLRILDKIFGGIEWQS